jgi:L-ascorbate metabolism protein UlaG (beta-lactamase superfamily)
MLLGTGSAAGVLADAWTPIGTSASGDRLVRMQASPQYGDGVFENPQPMYNDYMGMFTGFTDLSPVAEADPPPPSLAIEPGVYDTDAGLRVSWFGHSSMLFEVDGARFLVDPIWGERAGPVDWAGPKRWYAPPIGLEELPDVDAVLISHDHYDHLDHPTFEVLKSWDTTFIVPLGVGAHLEYWGVPPERIVELDWWETAQVGQVTVTSTPARHASGRQAFDQMATLWTGFALNGPEHDLYYSGDTGWFDALDDIGQRLGPFDVALVEVGAYNAAWPDWHIGPEQAVKASLAVRGELFVPVHWGMWNLAMHGWTEPAERVLVAAEDQGVRAYLPKPGEVFLPNEVEPTTTRWWPELPWQTAEEHPIESTADGVR